MDKILFRCHSLYDFATEPKVDKAKKYASAVEEYTFLLQKQEKGEKLGSVQQKNIVELPKFITELEPYKDSVTLSKSAISRLNRMKREIKYGILENIDNKYTQKGILCEDESISLLSFVENKFYKKNKTRYENDFLTGEPDLHINNSEIVDDIKTSWNAETFDNTTGLKKPYYWQVGVGYTWLTGAKKGRVIHCLVNTPIELIIAESNNILYKFKPRGMTLEEFGFSDEGTKIRTQIFRNHIYSNDGWLEGEYVGDNYWEAVAETHLLNPIKFIPIPKHERVKIFEFERNEEHIAYIKSKLSVARDELNRMLDKNETETYKLTLEDCE